jgi:hypothetical protein
MSDERKLRDRILSFIYDNYDRKKIIEERGGPEKDPPSKRIIYTFVYTSVETSRICKHFNINRAKLIEELFFDIEAGSISIARKWTKAYKCTAPLCLPYI